MSAPSAGALLLGAALLAGCAIGRPPSTVNAAAPAQFYAPTPLPHNGSLGQLSAWWQQQNDPLLVQLIDAAQTVNPSISAARSSIEQARATRTRAQAALLPQLDGVGNLSRSTSTPFNGQTAAPSTLGQIGLQASWELDVLGKNRASRDAGDERLAGVVAQWHAARVSVAAEVATTYFNARSCERLQAVAASDARSRSETARLVNLSTQAGFEAPATAALARASAAESNARATQQRALCDLDTKALVALTGIAEPALRQSLQAASAPTAGAPSAGSLAGADAPAQPLVAITAIPAVPADLISQRPDVFTAEREVAAASDEVGSARAARYPRLSLSGAITRGQLRSQGNNQGFDTWSIGPLAVTLPIFDGGSSAANVDAAVARYDNAAVQLRASVRQAVREVEEALVNLQSTADRAGDANTAAEGYRASLSGTRARHSAGLASLVELEDARRTLLAAQTALVTLERERASAWVALYRALGGGWTLATNSPPANPPNTPPPTTPSARPTPPKAQP